MQKRVMSKAATIKNIAIIIPTSIYGLIFSKNYYKKLYSVIFTPKATIGLH